MPAWHITSNTAVNLNTKRRSANTTGNYVPANMAHVAEAHMLLVELEREVNGRIDWTDLQAAKGTLNKHQQRRRHYEQVTGHR